MATHEIVLYTRQNCHLCHQAQALLESYGLAVQTVDIDADRALRELYDVSVPVVIIDGRERFHGRIDEVLLRRLLRATPDDNRA